MDFESQKAVAVDLINSRRPLYPPSEAVRIAGGWQPGTFIRRSPWLICENRLGGHHWRATGWHAGPSTWGLPFWGLTEGRSGRISVIISCGHCTRTVIEATVDDIIQWDMEHLSGQQ